MIFDVFVNTYNQILFSFQTLDLLKWLFDDFGKILEPSLLPPDIILSKGTLMPYF